MSRPRNLDHLQVGTGNEVVLSEAELRVASASAEWNNRVAAQSWELDLPGDLPMEPVQAAAQDPNAPAKGWLDSAWSWLGR